MPLKQTQASFVESAASYALLPTGVKTASFQSFTRNLTVEPADGVQLDPVNKQYRLAVTASHVNQGGQPAVTGNTLATADQRLLHFNGRLFFGAIETEFTSLAADPPLVSVTPTGIRSTLSVDNLSGSVVGSPKHVYGDGTALSVMLRANGNAELTSGSVVLGLNPPGSDAGEAAGIVFMRSPITLTPTVSTADFLVRLPPGLGYTRLAINISAPPGPEPGPG